MSSPTLSNTDPVPRGLLTLWARAGAYFSAKENTDMRKSAHAQVGTCSMFSHMLHAASRTHAARRDQRKCILFCFYSFFFVVYNTQGATGRRASG